MSKGKNKMVFEVQENETIDQCLDRIQKAGYIPVRRTEKPIFKEVKTGGKVDYEPAGRQIVFEAKLIEN
ncbi:NETI motif-containing protein [Bacillus sp. CMF12]|uniref:NETI motif-containing protein n=1 Tax=Bacillaceae TaxID=186817 RepID=UPI001FB33072|nr:MULTISPECIES: NETI motif-containing protein [Bacillaceae]UOE55793.1 NETI motif-containing protein [Cytobacillus oceanisediminis]USK50253.1 NETI motif-containing protein [Bacillus sp. CMF12]